MKRLGICSGNSIEIGSVEGSATSLIASCVAGVIIGR